MTHAISVVDLVKRHEDVTAVDGLSFTVEVGEIFGLLGPNGAGKSTTINILSGILEPTGGRATVLGFDVQRESAEVKERIGVCPQEPAFFPYLTGRENVELIGDLHLMPGKELKERAQLGLHTNHARTRTNAVGTRRRNTNPITFPASFPAGAQRARC